MLVGGPKQLRAKINISNPNNPIACFNKKRKSMMKRRNQMLEDRSKQVRVQIQINNLIARLNKIRKSMMERTNQMLEDRSKQVRAQIQINNLNNPIAHFNKIINNK